MFDFLRPYIARIIASWVAALCVWLASKFNIVIDAEGQLSLVVGALTIILAIYNTLYALLHKLLNKKFNPGDAASTHIALIEKTERDRLDR